METRIKSCQSSESPPLTSHGVCWEADFSTKSTNRKQQDGRTKLKEAITPADSRPRPLRTSFHPEVDPFLFWLLGVFSSQNLNFFLEMCLYRRVPRFPFSSHPTFPKLFCQLCHPFWFRNQILWLCFLHPLNFNSLQGNYVVSRLGPPTF